jgi:predicted dehydrogenase
VIGPVRRVTGATARTLEQRLITSQPLAGKVIDVEVPTHVAGLMDFHCGAVGTIITSFDVWAHHLPLLDVYGTEGSLSVPDPNGPGGVPRLSLAGSGEWQDVPLTHGYENTARSTGVADLAYALRTGRPVRASGQLAYHVLDLMHAFHDASDQGRHILLESTVERPAPLPVGLAEGELDE